MKGIGIRYGDRHMTTEEELIKLYFDAFNRHDLDGVMACFHDDAVIVDATGARKQGHDAVRRGYAAEFASMPDCRCDMRTLIGSNGRGLAESFFHGTRADQGKVIEAIGAEVLEIVAGKIKEIRDYHRPLPANAS
jgi:taurine dehydrogenase small subunit